MAAHDPEFLRRAAEARSRIVEVSPDGVDALRRQGVVLLDLHRPVDDEAGHLNEAISVQYEQLEELIARLLPDCGAPIDCVCNASNRGALAADISQHLVSCNVRSIAGGLSAYNEALPQTS